ncbi:cell division protein SepF [Corynebacterium lizhenjunii]|uniref:Cell division protein SepF n=1 Tax=Corynebacterium lizhenjunii TaxID=2709394 RepID=A0A7T0KF11_9CORY|nr:cell division protein SepF [Corynebacterium lizhenjunii]QPK78498.1 cell division protein SepF [Corynebacterium lizhenjunii]
MSFIDRTKEFFGLAPMDMDSEDAYYAQESRYDSGHDADRDAKYATRYESKGSAAYAPRTAPAPSYESARPAYEPTIVPLSLRDYREAPKIGDSFRDGDVVILEVTDAEPGHAKRLVDFTAGLAYAVDGSKMRNLTREMDTSRKVFALLPAGVDIDDPELQRMAHLR